MMEPITAAALGAVTTKAIEKSTTNLIDKISFRLAKDKYDVIKFSLAKGLPNYLAANYAKCETLKTLLNRNDPIALEACFVAPDFKLKRKIISSTDFLDYINQSNGKVVISGLAGSGKSVFLKYSFRNVIEEGYSYYPIFFELRSLNGLPPKDGFLISEIYRSIKSSCDSFTRAQFNHGLKKGAFYFLLDGFDELKQEIREQVSSEIEALARNHRKCAILVASRPSSDFVSWEGFSEAALLPFDLEKAVEYISKLSFDEDKKKDFLEDLQGGLFEKNKDFLSNPLLSAMMLLTYDSFGEIPEKRHTFYSKCFEVLAREHDASKGRYKRELFSDMAMDQLEKVFMFFCAISYVERQFSFDENQMKKYVSDAISSCGVDARVDAVIRDFRESISIMELVGLNYEFAHRSFQEYFYAKFVVTDRKLSLENKVGWLSNSWVADDTLEMIADMDKTYFEDEFLLPHTKSLDVKLSKIDPDSNPAGVLSQFFSSMHIGDFKDRDDKEEEPHIYYTVSKGRNRFFLHQAMLKYRDEISWKPIESSAGRKRKSKRQHSILKREFGGEIKLHHTNNKKLIKIAVSGFAAEIKMAMSLLRRHLEEKHEKRKRGLGLLIRREYVNGGPVL